MSSSYYIFCLSHDPATNHGDYQTGDDAARDIAVGLPGHPHCDLVIGRMSGGLCEIGCPPDTGRPGQHRCTGHRDTEWTDTAWLRLLAHVHHSTDEAAKVLAAARGLRCWSRERLYRLRHELGLDITREQP